MSDEVAPDVAEEEPHVFAHAGVASVAADAPTPGEEAPVPDSGLVQLPCAFIVYQTPDGHWAADDNLSPEGAWIADENHRPILIGRKATFHDMYHAAADIKKDIEAFETTNRTVSAHQQMMAQMANQVRQQQQNAEIAAALAKAPGGGAGVFDLSKMRRP
jgi:hypothetical protein